MNAPEPQTASGDEVVHILAVDDVEENLVALGMLLKRPGLKLECASDGSEALELLLQRDIALALIDVNMPGMDGFELAELMRGSERTKAVPIIFLTAGAADRERVFQGYEAGAVDFLVKPLDPYQLASKVEVFAQLHRAKRQLAGQVEAVQAAQRLSDLFVGVLGHDLRNPLSSIVTAAHLLERNATADGPIRNKAQVILRGARRMDRLISQVLDFARARVKGGVPIAPAPTDLAQMAKQAVAELGEAAARVTVVVSGDTHGEWDPDRLMQAVGNLIANAVEHGDPAEPIRVEVDGGAPDEVRFETKNGGVIPPHALNELFSPFKPRPPSSSQKGLGLGLYIASEMVRSHGGRLDVRSVDGEGTSFTFKVPRR